MQEYKLSIVNNVKNVIVLKKKNVQEISFLQLNIQHYSTKYIEIYCRV